MMRRLFLPEKIGHHRILAQRIVGLAVHDDCVSLALVYAKIQKTFIEKLALEKIPDGSVETFAERAAESLKKIIASVKTYDQIRISIPASLVVFKELQLQFTDPEKIRMVLDYEVESMLPFSLQEAIVDFIITKVDKTQQTSQVLVAAIRSADLQEHLDIYAKAGIDPVSITIDLFALYGLYQQIPAYYSLPHGTALVALEPNSTRIVFIQNGQLRLTRLLPRGIASVIKLISDETKVPVADIEKQLKTYGLRGGDEALMKMIQKHFVLLLHDIQFTLNSFSLKLNFYDGVSKILFTGMVHYIQDWVAFSNDTLQISCEEFECRKLLENQAITNKVKEQIARWNDFLLVLGTVLPSQQQSDFDLRRKQFAYYHHGLIVRQLSIALGLILTILVVIGVKGYMDIYALAAQAAYIEATEVNRFKTEKIFPKNKFPSKPVLRVVVKEGEKIVNEKRDVWASFSHQKMRPLDILLELTTIIDKKQFDITVDEVSISTKEGGIPMVEVEGLFKSKTGAHFVEWGEQVQKRFKDSSRLKIVTMEDSMAPEGGVKFTVKLKLKEA